MNSKKPKIKHETICNTFRNGGLKNIDVAAKIKSLQCSWVKRLFDGKFHELKLIPQYLIKKYFGPDFIFHSNVNYGDSLICSFPNFYKSLFKSWKDSFSYTSDSPSCIRSQFLWFNKELKIEKKLLVSAR